MDFFRAQDDARRKTWQLLLLFAAAVAALVLLTNLLVGVTLAWTGTHVMVTSLDPLVRTLPTAYWPWVTFAVVAIVGAASLYKYVAMRGGGSAVAALLDARRIDPGSFDVAHRRLQNVVEEMAIASGMPVPPTYVIADPAINAFAAGFGPDDAIVAVTQGTLDHLTRDELQGVIGHEFSHLLNGDSRINLRLVAALHGILFIGLVGRALTRGVRFQRRSSGGAPVVLIGVGLIAIGYAGTFCGNLIKAAVSRQREFLADAASVQFTRNPGGIAGALKKIGALPAGATLASPRAGEISHFFFAQALRLWMGGLMATHPPLEKRILALEPRWNGSFPALAGIANETSGPQVPGTQAFAGEVREREAEAASGHTTEDPDIAAAQELLDGLPLPLRDAARDPSHARAICFALLLDTNERGAPRLERLEDVADARLREAVTHTFDQTRRLALLPRLTLVSLCMPALKELSREQYGTFVGQLVALIKADRRIELFEWVLHRLMVKELKPAFEPSAPRRVRFTRLEQTSGAVGELLSAIVVHGGADIETQRRLFDTARGNIECRLDTAPDPDFARLNAALKQLRALAPLAKPRLLKACAACIPEDAATDDQRALLLGIGAMLDCPLPPTFRIGSV